MRKSHFLTAALFLTLLFPKTASAMDQPVHIFPGMEGLIFDTLVPPPTQPKLEVNLDTLLLETPNQSAKIAPKASPKSTTKLPKKVIQAEATEKPTPVITPTPTPKPTNTPNPQKTTPKPTATSTPLPQNTPTPKPTAASVSPNLQLSNGGLDADKLFGLVNNYRSSQNLPALQKDQRACEVAVSRAPELKGEFASGNLHAGIKNRKLPYWNSEIIILANSEEAALNWWLSDDLHREQIVGNYTYACVACDGNACVEELTNFTPK